MLSSNAVVGRGVVIAQRFIDSQTGETIKDVGRSGWPAPRRVGLYGKRVDFEIAKYFRNRDQL